MSVLNKSLFTSKFRVVYYTVHANGTEFSGIPSLALTFLTAKNFQAH